MQVKYEHHCGSDLSVVNSARVSYSKKSAWKENPVWGISNETGEPYWISPGVLQDRDKKLIGYLARGCSSGDWDAIIDEVMTANRHEVAEILGQVKNMGSHSSPFNHTFVTLHVKAPIFVARQLV